MKLSIGMIVKNEDKNLKRCLTSLKPLLKAVESELIIVDTGSTDNTVNIAREFTDKIYFHPWENDYAKMRNFTVNYAQGEWFFFVDADEELVEYRGIVDFLTTNKSTQFNGAFIKIHNLFQADNENQYSISSVLRLFRKTKNFQFQGVIHEEPLFNPPVTFLESLLVHYGYVNNDQELKTRKLELYVPILLAALENDPENLNYLYYLAQTFAAYSQDPKDALQPAVKAYEIIKRKKLKTADYPHIYNTLSRLYLFKGNLVQAEEIAAEGLRNKEWAIDLWFNLAKAQAMLQKNKEAVQSYQKYFYYVEHYDEYAENDNKIISSSITRKEEAHLDLSVLYKESNNLILSVEELKKVKSPGMLQMAIGHALRLFLDLENYGELLDFWERIKKTENEELKKNFYQTLENLLISTYNKQQAEVNKLFQHEPAEYGVLNTIRSIGKKQSLNDQCMKQIKELDFTQLDNYYGDIIYFLIQSNLPLDSIDYAIPEEKLEIFFNYLLDKYEDVSTAFLAYLQYSRGKLSREEKLTLETIRIQMLMQRAILLVDSLANDQYEWVLDSYIQDGIDYLEQVYQDRILKDGQQHLLRNKEEVFFLYMKLAKSAETVNKAEYLRNLKKALREYPSMKKGIEILLHRMMEQSMADKPALNSEMQAYAQIVKRNLEQLIQKGLFKEAKEIIRSYEQLIPNDPEIIEMKVQYSDL